MVGDEVRAEHPIPYGQGEDTTDGLVDPNARMVHEMKGVPRSVETTPLDPRLPEGIIVVVFDCVFHFIQRVGKKHREISRKQNRQSGHKQLQTDQWEREQQQERHKCVPGKRRRLDLLRRNDRVAVSYFYVALFVLFVLQLANMGQRVVLGVLSPHRSEWAPENAVQDVAVEKVLEQS